MFTVASGIARTVAVIQVSFTKDEFGPVQVCIWAILEPCIAISVACGLVMRPALEKIFPAFKPFSFRRSDRDISLPRSSTHMNTNATTMSTMQSVNGGSADQVKMPTRAGLAEMGSDDDDNVLLPYPAEVKGYTGSSRGSSRDVV